MKTTRTTTVTVRTNRKHRKNRATGLRRSVLATSIATLAASLLLASSDRGFAASGSWLAAPTNGNWEPAAGQTNWTNGTGVGAFPGATFGVSNTDVATFNVVSATTSITPNNVGTFLNLGGITFTGTLADGSTFKGTLTNRFGAGYSGLDGFGFIDAVTAVNSPLP